MKSWCFSPPPNEARSPTFAIRFLGAISTLAADVLLRQWQQAGDALLKTQGHVGDPLFERYAMDHHRVSVQGQGVAQAFAITFAALYQALYSTDLFALYEPTRSTQNRYLVALRTYRDLVEGHNRDRTRPIVRELGLTEQNFFARAEKIVDTVLTTLWTHEH